MTTEKHPPLLSVRVAVASDLTGLSKTKIYDAVNSGKLPARKHGADIVIRYRDLEAFIDSLELVVKDDVA